MAEGVINTFIVSIAAGVLPPLLWLMFFWLREDRLHPEPKKIIALVFALGMLATFPAKYGEEFALRYLEYGSFLLIVIWAFIEEFVKYCAAYFGAMWHNRNFDEPIDAMIYLITAGLGFAGLENALFFFKNFHDGGLLFGLASNGFRFLGATMLHVLSSATLGAFIGFAFYQNSWVRERRFFMGLILATLLHALYNKLIMMNVSGSYQALLSTFGIMWVGIIIILFFFEKIKSIFITKTPKRYLP